MVHTVARRIALLLVCGAVPCGCGIRAGYVSNDPVRTWPESYYYAAVRADARQWQAVNDSGAGVASTTASQGAILADLPFSVIADTAVLPVLLCTAAVNAISDQIHDVPPADGGWRAPGPVPGDEVAQNPGW